MRLGILLPPFDPRPAGLGVYVEQVCSRLAARNPDCRLLTAEGGPRPPWAARLPLIGPADSTLARLLGRLTPPALRRLALVNSWLPRTLHEYSTDVLFVPFQLAMRWPRIPQVVVMHDLTALRRPEASSPLRRLFLQRYLRPALARVERVVAVSQNTKADLEDLWGLPGAAIEVVHEGFDATVYRPHAEAEIEAVRDRFGIPRPYVVYVGTFSPHKNLRTALAALAKLRDRRENLTFVVAGRTDAGDFASFGRDIRRFELENRVRILGYVPKETLGPLLSGATAFLYPTLYEGFGLSALEALACGTPVLASNVASLPEIVGDGGRLLDPHDPAQWAQALERLLAPEAELAALRSQALARASEFDWDRAADRLQQILTEAAHGKVPGSR